MTTIFIRGEKDKKKLLAVLRETKTPYKVTVKKGGTRSLEQNAYLWGVVYEIILTETGLQDQGWAPDDLHEYFLGEYYGWEELHGLGRRKVRPQGRSSTMSTMEFMDYIAYIQQWGAHRGIDIPDPNEEIKDESQETGAGKGVSASAD